MNRLTIIPLIVTLTGTIVSKAADDREAFLAKNCSECHDADPPKSVKRRLRYHDEESVIDDQKKGEGQTKSFRVSPESVVIFDDNSPTAVRQFTFRQRGRYRIRTSASAVQAAGRPAWLKVYSTNWKVRDLLGYFDLPANGKREIELIANIEAGWLLELKPYDTNSSGNGSSCARSTSPNLTRSSTPNSTTSSKRRCWGRPRRSSLSSSAQTCPSAISSKIDAEQPRDIDNGSDLFGRNLGNANSHDTRNLPILLAGGGFKLGQHTAFDAKKNTPLCNLYLSMLQRLGVETDAFGSSTGTLTGLV